MVVPTQFRVALWVAVALALITLGGWAKSIHCDAQTTKQETARADHAEQVIIRTEAVARKDEVTLTTVMVDAQHAHDQFDAIFGGINDVQITSADRVPDVLTRLWQCADIAANPGSPACPAGGVSDSVHTDKTVSALNPGIATVGERGDGRSRDKNGDLSGMRPTSGVPRQVD